MVSTTTGGSACGNTTVALPTYFVTPEQFQAVGDGVTDDTVAVKEAIATGKSVFFQKLYHVSSAIPVACAGQVLFGAGFASGLTTSAINGDVLYLTGSNIEIHSLQITASVTRTGGSAINTQAASQVFIHHCLFTYFWWGVCIGMAGNVSGSQIFVDQSTLVFGAVGGSAIVVLAIADGALSKLNIAGQSPTQQLASGVYIVSAGELTLDHVETLFSGNGLAIGPQASNIIQCLTCSNCVFDTGNGSGIVINCGGIVDLVKITSTWSCTAAGPGFSLATTGSGQINQVDVVDSVFSNNNSDGVFVADTGTKGLSLIGCSMGSNNGNGFECVANVADFQIIGCKIGATGQFVGNSGYGIKLGTNAGNFVVQGNYFAGNSSGPLNFAGTGAAPGVGFFIKDNVGLVTKNIGALATTAGTSVFTIPHGLAYPPNLAEITTTLNSSLGSSSGYAVANVTATTFQISFFPGAPGAGVIISWQAKSAGA